MLPRSAHLRLVDSAETSEVPADLSFSAVYQAYSKHVASIGFRLLGRDSEVDDLVQDVFLVAFHGLQTLREPGAVKGWLSIVAVRVARKKLKWRRLRAFWGGDSDAAYESIASEGATPEQRALLGNVYRVLDRISVADRLAWTLRHVEGESLEEVARLCDCSLATAKRRIASAHEQIEREVSRG